MVRKKSPAKATSDLEKNYPAIESHGIIGDMQTVALVGLDGRISFLYLPEFDSPTVFAAILDPKCGGRFTVAPQLAYRSERAACLSASLRASLVLTRLSSVDAGRGGHWCAGPEGED